MSVEVKGYAWKEKDAPFERFSYTVDSVPPGEALVKVAGCGVCHTDISFAFMGVPTRQKPPLILGHEISGTVEEVGEGVDDGLKGKAVLVPAVLPCGECEMCKAGYRRTCTRQVMPGNDRHGGFASHVLVPARYLCPVPKSVLDKYDLWQLSIVSDAVTTPFQSVKLAGVQEGDLAVCIGVGGIGIHGVQLARAAGARVVALDIDDKKLEAAKEAGAGVTINVRGIDPKDLKKQVKQAAKELSARTFGWKIFETSGTAAGQQTAFS
ncbi:MAG: 6-hydroxycyclohex-1-ene-1-carbonyl-CoA dehydrogenase, partial [Deltaproteobacteria bacterium]